MAIIKKEIVEKFKDVTYINEYDMPHKPVNTKKEPKPEGQRFHIEDISFPELMSKNVGSEIEFSAKGILKSSEIRKREDGKTKESYTIEVTKISLK